MATRPTSPGINYHWLFPAFLSIVWGLSLLKPELITGFYVITLLTCIMLSFISCLGLEGWKMYLQHKENMEWDDRIRQLEKEIKSKDIQISKFQTELEESKQQLADAQNAAPPDSEKWINLAEKFRSTTFTKAHPERQTSKVPSDIRAFIIKKLS